MTDNICTQNVWVILHLLCLGNQMIGSDSYCAHCHCMLDSACKKKSKVKYYLSSFNQYCRAFTQTSMLVFWQASISLTSSTYETNTLVSIYPLCGDSCKDPITWQRPGLAASKTSCTVTHWTHWQNTQRHVIDTGMQTNPHITRENHAGWLTGFIVNSVSHKFDEFSPKQCAPSLLKLPNTKNRERERKQKNIRPLHRGMTWIAGAQWVLISYPIF